MPPPRKSSTVIRTVNDSGDQVSISLPWVHRPRLVVLFVVACTLLTATGFVAGRFVRPATGLPDGQAVSVGPTFTPVVERVVRPVAGRHGVVKGRRVTAVPAPRLDDPEDQRSVVSRSTVHIGDTVRSGRVLCVVSGRPVFLLRLPVPPYRSLHAGDRGDDVRQVQRALRGTGHYRGTVDGVFGLLTQAAVADLYRSAGFSPRTEPPASIGSQTASTPASPPGSADGQVLLPLGEVFGLTQHEAVVAGVTRRGAVLEEGDDVVMLRTGGLRVVARVGVDERADYAVGTAVRVSAPTLTAGAFKGTVTAVSGFREAATGGGAESGDGVTEGAKSRAAEVDAPQEGGGAGPGRPGGARSDLPGYDVTIRVSGDVRELVAGRAVTVMPRAMIGEAGPAVPLTAVRQNGHGTFVRVEDHTAVTGSRPVRVDVVAEVDGWAAIAPVRGLSIGTRVQVTP